MKGLLHRLAARAAGTTVPVRSDARLPFGEANLGWGEMDDIEGRPEPLVMAAAMSPTARAHEASRPSAQPDGSSHAAPVPMHHGRSTASAPDLGADLRLSAPTRSPAAPFVPAGDSDPGLPARAVEHLSPDATQAPPGGDDASEVATQLSPPSRRPEVAFRLNGLPPLLMPGIAAERPSSPSGMVAAVRGPLGSDAGTPAAEEPSEVHIHIGRIEVTAVPDAPSLRSRPGKKRAPMSLDAYLAARSRT
jgi:hypothetical protein